MDSPANPLIPAAYDIIWAGVTLLLLVVLVAALVSIARARKGLSAGHALAWTAIVIFVPLVGPLAWLFIGRRARTADTLAPAADSAIRDSAASTR